MSDTEMDQRRMPTAEQIATLTDAQRARITPEELASFTEAQLLHLLPLSPDQITQILHPGAQPPPPPPPPQQQQQQPPRPRRPGPLRITHPLDPNIRPSQAQLAREESLKRKRDGADEDAERAREIRALVRTADSRHLQESILPFEDRPDAELHSDYHVAHWKGDVEPCVVNTLPNFDIQATAITLEDALAFNESKDAWLDVLRTCAANRYADDGYACLVSVMDQVIKFDDIPVVRERIQEGFSRMCHSDGIVAISPQPTRNARDGHPNFSPYTYMLRLPLEAGLQAAAGYAYRIKWASCPEGILVTVLLPDLAPPTHVGSYEDMRALPAITPEIKASIRAKVQAHVASRFPSEITKFLRANNARLWQGGQLEPWWCELLQESINIKVWESKTSDGKTSVTISVYCLGVFDAGWLHSVWEDALLGDTINLGEFGKYTRTPTDRKRKCSICHDRDHHARVCPVWNHPLWPEELRQRREARILAEKGRDKTPEASGSSFRGGGLSRGRGSNGRGRGGHNNAFGPPPPPYPYGYAQPGYPPPFPYGGYGPGPYAGYEQPNPSRGNGRGRGRGRGGW